SELEIILSNKGTMRAKNINITLTETHKIVSIEKTNFKIESLDKGASATIKTKLEAKQSGRTQINANITYLDVMNKKYTVNKSVSISAILPRAEIQVKRFVETKNIQSGHPFKIITQLHNVGTGKASDILINEMPSTQWIKITPQKHTIEKLEPNESENVTTECTILKAGEFKILGAEIFYNDISGKHNLVTKDIIVNVSPSSPNVIVSIAPLSIKLGEQKNLEIKVVNKGPVPIQNFSLHLPALDAVFGDMVKVLVPVQVNIKKLAVGQEKVFALPLKGLAEDKKEFVFSYEYYTPENEPVSGTVNALIEVSKKPHLLTAEVFYKEESLVYGKSFELFIKIKNVGETDASDIRVIFPTSSKDFSLGSESVQTIDLLGPGDNAAVPFKITPKRGGTIHLKNISIQYVDSGIKRKIKMPEIKFNVKVE
ncbi:MAG: hypothetical protein ACP6IU_14345, partial [Candidatus Asgardarchaeia archaeon]